MDKGIFGLKNRGNTCYLNTSIQCLSNITPLTEYFLNNNHVTDLNNRYFELKGKSVKEIILTKEYSKLIKALWNTTTPIEPKTFHELIQKYDDRFSGYEQQDAQESLSLILDYLHEGLKYDVEINYSGLVENSLDEIVVESIKNWKNHLQNKYSVIADLFFGQFVNKIMSLENHNNDELISKTFEMFSILTIPIYGKTLYDSMSKYFEKEILESKYLDEKNNKYINAYRQIKLMIVPKFLIIVLKRYRTSNNGGLIKSQSMVSFPFDDLDLSAYCEGYDNINCELKLISIGCHRGGLNGGHYFSICKHSNEKWYKYDDDDVKEFNIKDNRNSLFKDGYILIYQKINN